nr:MAG TPA: hypothetical protein [Caudoviricetes sp.]
MKNLIRDDNINAHGLVFGANPLRMCLWKQKSERG